MRSPFSRLFLAACLVAGPASAQGAEKDAPRRVYGRTDVYARTVTAVVTDAKGNPVASPPSAADLEVTEDGAAATVLAVEPVRPRAAATSSAARPTPARGEPDEEDERRLVRQVLYVDTALLRMRSVRDVAESVRGALAAILAAGPLEIVVADPSPRAFEKSTDDAAALGAALTRLSAGVVGRDEVTRVRRTFAEARQALGSTRAQIAANRQPSEFRSQAASGAALYEAGGAEQGRSLVDGPVRASANEETAIVDGALKRLVGWSAGSPESSYGILFWASDGFDVDQTAFYAPGEGNLARKGVETRLPFLLERATEALRQRGWVVVPIGLRAFADAGALRGADSGGPTAAGGAAAVDGADAPLYKSPADPLRTFAVATGGEVVTSADALAPALSGLSKAYVISYQVSRPPDGKPHVLSIKSKRPGLVVRAAASVVAGTPESTATQRALMLLSGTASNGELPVTVAVADDAAAGAGKRTATLAVRVALAEVRDVIARLGTGKLRVTLLFEAPGAETEPHHEALSLPESGVPTAYTVKIPVSRPETATSVAVVVEELGTGLWGAARARFESAAAKP